MEIKEVTCIDCLKPESQCVCKGITSTPEPFISEHLTKMDVALILGEYWIRNPQGTIDGSYAYFYKKGVENERSK